MADLTAWGAPRTQSIAATLDVVTSVFNPIRFRTRYQLYHQFATHLATFSQARLWTVECALGDRPFEVTSADNPHHLQLRGRDELWLKENLCNLGIARLGADADYIAFVDADVQFTNPFVIDETLHALQHHPIVQMFSHARDLGPTGAPMGDKEFTGFGFGWATGMDPGPMTRGGYTGRWHPGFAWAARRDTLNQLGGLLDWSVLGSGDTLMAMALIGRLDDVMFDDLSPGFQAYCRRWRDRAKALQADVGYVPGLLIHGFHGAKVNRQYFDRRKILVEHAFDPFTDLIPDVQGLYQLTPFKPGLRDAIRRYLRERDEDSTHVPPPTVPNPIPPGHGHGGHHHRPPTCS